MSCLISNCLISAFVYNNNADEQDFYYDLKEPYQGLVDYAMIGTKEPFIKNEKSTLDVLISWVNKI